ncbi:hypothetical protein [Streptomyces sp. NPDC091416]|uniref:hypothetical protein n=1 Tax=Streptomyces sp. NPDC091416 TaxID=3366003 RepID=UPI0037FD0F36
MTRWILPCGMVAVMVVLTPTVIRTRSTSWAIGWTAMLLGAVVLLMLLALVERLTHRRTAANTTAGSGDPPLPHRTVPRTPCVRLRTTTVASSR